MMMLLTWLALHAADLACLILDNASGTDLVYIPYFPHLRHLVFRQGDYLDFNDISLQRLQVLQTLCLSLADSQLVERTPLRLS